MACVCVCSLLVACAGQSDMNKKCVSELRLLAEHVCHIPLLAQSGFWSVMHCTASANTKEGTGTCRWRDSTVYFCNSTVSR